MSATKKDPLVSAKEQAARYSYEQERLDLEVKKIIGFEGAPSNEREKEVLSLKAKRMSLTAKLEHCLNQINGHRRGVVELTDTDLNTLVARKKELLAEISSLPDLGMTRSEWENLNPDFKMKSVGRPSVSLEQRLIRANKGFQDSIALIRELGGSVDIDEISSMVKNPNVVEKRDGRPKHDMIGVLDTKLKTLRAKIEHITSGEAQRHIDERMKESLYSSSGKRLGRSFEDPMAKLERLRAEESDLLAKISKFESRLEGIDQIQRTLKVTRDKRNELQRAINDCTDDTQRAELDKEYDKVLKVIRGLEGQIKAQKDPNATVMRPRHARTYEKPDVTALVQKPSSVARPVVSIARDLNHASITPVAESRPESTAIYEEHAQGINDKRVIFQQRNEESQEVQKLSEESRARVNRLLGSRG